MAKTIKGIYEKGVVRPLEDPKVEGPQEVYILFPEAEKVERVQWPTVTGETLAPLVGIVTLGGNALKDTERVYNESLPR